MRAFRWDALPSNGVAPFDLGREQVPSSEVESTETKALLRCLGNQELTKACSFSNACLASRPSFFSGLIAGKTMASKFKLRLFIFLFVSVCLLCWLPESYQHLVSAVWGFINLKLV